MQHFIKINRHGVSVMSGAVTDRTMNWTSAHQFVKLKRTWVMQHDNDSKRTSNSTCECLPLYQKIKKVLEQPSQSLDLNPIEMYWHDLKQAILAQTLQCDWIKAILLRTVSHSDVKDLLPAIVKAWLLPSYWVFGEAFTFSHRARYVWIAFFFSFP